MTPGTPLFEANTVSGPVPPTVKDIGAIAALSHNALQARTRGE